MIFSIDAIIAFSLMLMGMLVFVTVLSNSGNSAVQQAKELFLEEKTFAIADSLVKNYNQENTLLGACTTDLKKKRVLSNELTAQNLLSAKPIELEGFFVKSISYNTGAGEKQILLSQKDSDKCISAKRFVLLDGAKTIISVKGCLNE